MAITPKSSGISNLANMIDVMKSMIFHAEVAPKCHRNPLAALYLNAINLDDKHNKFKNASFISN